MRRRNDLATVAKLASVQRVKRTAAEAALIAARSAMESAQTAEQQARDDSREAQAEWADYVGEAGFSPEYAKALSGKVIARETAVDQAAQLALTRQDIHARHQNGWQQAEAKVRHTDANLRKLKRKTVRATEEKRLSALEDRTALAWWQG